MLVVSTSFAVLNPSSNKSSSNQFLSCVKKTNCEQRRKRAIVALAVGAAIVIGLSFAGSTYSVFNNVREIQALFNPKNKQFRFINEHQLQDDFITMHWATNYSKRTDVHLQLNQAMLFKFAELKSRSYHFIGDFFNIAIENRVYRCPSSSLQGRSRNELYNRGTWINWSTFANRDSLIKLSKQATTTLIWLFIRFTWRLKWLKNAKVEW